LGLNEFAGYLAVGLTAWLTGYIASVYGLRPQPFYLGIGVVLVGLFLSVLFAHESLEHSRLEARSHTSGNETGLTARHQASAAGIWISVTHRNYAVWILGALLQGLGTAMLYPGLLAAIGDVAHPAWRASVLGVYRFWRDLGYAVGALLSGIVADLLGMATAIHVVAALTLASGLFVAVFMPETLSKTLTAEIIRLDESAKS